MLILILIADASTVSFPKTKWIFLFGSISSNSAGRLIPMRAAPPPPTARSGKSVKQKIPRYAQKKKSVVFQMVCRWLDLQRCDAFLMISCRMASIRVSRKKGGSGNSSPRGAVVQSSWLDVWKGFR